jgi:hypothetical protein
MLGDVEFCVRRFLAVALAGVVSVASVAVVSPAGAAEPDEDGSNSIPLDIHTGYKKQRECSTSAKPGATALLKLLIKNFGGGSLGISRSCGAAGVSEHKEGRALDWKRDVKHASHRKSVARAIKWLTRNNGEVAIRLGVMYIIWDQEIWSTYYPEMGWRKMENRGSYSQNHKDHVHISLSWDGAMMRTSWWTGKPLTEKPCQDKTCKKGKVRYPALTTTRPFASVKAPTPFVPYPSQTPEVSGSPIVGNTLGVTVGDWWPANVDGPALGCPESATCGYQWYRGSAKIAGATDPTYTVRSADYKKAISVAVTVEVGNEKVTKRAGGTTAAAKPKAEPTPTAPDVSDDPTAPEVTTAKPKITGTAKYRKTLRVKPGNWGPEGVKLSYRWYRGGKAIPKATKSSYKLTKKDRGKKIKVKVTGSLKGYSSRSSTSVARKVKK